MKPSTVSSTWIWEKCQTVINYANMKGQVGLVTDSAESTLFDPSPAGVIGDLTFHFTRATLEHS